MSRRLVTFAIVIGLIVTASSSFAAPTVKFMGVETEATTVAFVCDGSRWTKKSIDELSDELLRTVEAMSPDQRFSVIFFADDNAFGPEIGRPLSASDENKQKLRDWLTSITFGDKRDGLYPIRGGVTPDLKGIMQGLFNTYQSARSAPKFPSAEEQQRIEAGELIPGEVLDERTGGQKRADMLRGILTQVAQDPRTPTMGGMPPTVMVHVNAADLIRDAGLGCDVFEANHRS